MRRMRTREETKNSYDEELLKFKHWPSNTIRPLGFAARVRAASVHRTVKEARDNFAGMLVLAESGTPVVVLRYTTPQAVIISVALFNALLAAAGKLQTVEPSPDNLPEAY